MAARVSKSMAKPPSKPSFVLGSRPPDMYAPRVAPRATGDITQTPRIKPMTGQTQYGKTSGFGNTGLTNES